MSGSKKEANVPLHATKTVPANLKPSHWRYRTEHQMRDRQPVLNSWSAALGKRDKRRQRHVHRYGEVENVEFNSDALGIARITGPAKAAPLRRDLPQATFVPCRPRWILSRVTRRRDPCAGVGDTKNCWRFTRRIPDLFHLAEVTPDEAIELAARAAASKADKRITNTEGGSFNSHYGIKVLRQQPRHVAGLVVPRAISRSVPRHRRRERRYGA